MRTKANFYGMLKNQMKKLIILAVYLIIFLIFAFFLYLWLWPEKKGSCSDGIKNQNEKEIDCGGVCGRCVSQPKHDLELISSGFLESGKYGEYDLYGEIENRNIDFGSGEFDYVFSLEDSNGGVITTKSGTGFILPGEKKYLVENNIESSLRPDKVRLKIGDPEWIEFMEYEKPQFKIINKKYNRLASSNGASEAIAILRNETPFEFNSIRLEVILRDPAQEIIAINSTFVNSVRSGENREFRVFWPNRFPGEVANMEVQAEVNIFDSESFAKRYLDAGELQKYNYIP